LEKFKKLKFNRFIDRFNLNNIQTQGEQNSIEINYQKLENPEKLINEIIETKKIFYYLNTEKKNNNQIIEKEITGIVVYSEKEEKSFLIENINVFKDIFEKNEILKIGYKQKEDYILLKQVGINPTNLMFDIEIAGYILNSTISKYSIEYLSNEYLRI